ncbi:sigma-70 family RNA polymerase sigma factor [Lentzea sp. NPDC034063]|uniref:RNA polymerase sigma factor n=1 Tax=unclassified Lentzea TaxID=2643253 RepID=UPI003410D75C
MAPQPSSDEELTRAAQAGDVTALGVLLARHEAGMRAVALSIAGHGPDAEDAVQDAMLVALSRIGDVREPAAVGAWLRMIVRNGCRTRLRSAGLARPVADLELISDESPERIVEQHAMRDWLWHAIGDLAPALRMTVLLRHFSRASTYEQIATLCGVPVGTVRSRLSQARAKLGAALQATAATAHDDVAALAVASRAEGLETLDAMHRGDLGRLMAERWAPDAMLFDGRDPVGGRDFLVRGAAGDLEAGVRQRFADTVVGRDITIWEMDILNPADNPRHCPPAVTWVMSLEDGRVSQLRLFHPAVSE